MAHNPNLKLPIDFRKTDHLNSSSESKIKEVFGLESIIAKASLSNILNFINKFELLSNKVNT